ncbi:MAG TPA: hypothetical protein VMV94_05340 [Phycisphaerae bacterium]|nr:hypothetical protein [Phycisphaerae bacterium]
MATVDDVFKLLTDVNKTTLGRIESEIKAMNATTLGRMEAEVKNIQTTLTAIHQDTQAVLNAINYASKPDKGAMNCLERIEADVQDIQAHVG